jgi:hypothetical protein
VAAEVAAGRLQAAKIVEPGIERFMTLSFARQRMPSAATREVARLTRDSVDWAQLCGPRAAAQTPA